MQIDRIEFKNIDPETEDFLYTKTNEMLGALKSRGEIRAYYEKVGEYGYSGSIGLDSEWGYIFAAFKDSNVFSLFKRLKMRIKSQLLKKKDEAVEIQTIMPQILPRIEIPEQKFPVLEMINRPILYPEMQHRKVINVLIVDDDVDSALAIDTIFKRFGCNTTFAFDCNEARKKISSGKADVIVLDWLLDHEIKADQIVRQSVRFIEKFDGLKRRLHRKPPKVITYSSLKNSNISFPKNDYFVHHDHWQKPIMYSDVTKKTFNLIESMSFGG